jgi:tRNA (guanine-N7-)-methyltransferase
MNNQPQKPLATTPMRQTRSFVRRQGRMTDAQRRAIETLWDQYVLPADALPQILSDSEKNWIMEIGFGMGESLLQMAKANPEQCFLGIEVHKPGIGALMAAAATHQLSNLFVVCGDALDILQNQIPSARLSRIQIFFPDPWPKKRHHKRRLINPDNATLMLDRLMNGGELHIATDWPNYAEHIQLCLRNRSEVTLLEDLSRPAYRPLTKFEQRGQRLGHPIVDLRFIKQA